MHLNIRHFIPIKKNMFCKQVKNMNCYMDYTSRYECFIELQIIIEYSEHMWLLICHTGQ